MKQIITKNKKAYFDYFILESMIAGIVLEGSEVKSIRAGGISLLDSFIIIKNQEIFLKNAYIKSFQNASNFKPNERKDRKLLLNKNEIIKLERLVKEKSNTIIPLQVMIKDNKVKIEIGVAKGKKQFDKKQSLKEQSQKREIQQATKNIKNYS